MATKQQTKNVFL